MKYLVVGGAGFIGAHLCEWLLDRGHIVYCVDNFQTGCLSNIEKCEIFYPQFQFYGRELRCQDAKEVDGIFMLAGSVGVKYIDENPCEAIKNNLKVAEEVFQIADKYNKKLIYFSTSEVYGSRIEQMTEDMNPKIGPPNQLRWGYACSKLINEFRLMSSTFPSIIVRPFNIVGSRQLPNYGMVIPTFVHQALKNEPLYVYGDGSQCRCFCHIDDAIRAVYKLMLDRNINKEIYNIGNPQNFTTIIDLAELIIDLLNSQSRIEVVPYKRGFSKNQTDILFRVPDISKIQHDIGWTPEKGLKDIIYHVSSNINN